MIEENPYQSQESKEQADIPARARDSVHLACITWAMGIVFTAAGVFFRQSFLVICGCINLAVAVAVTIQMWPAPMTSPRFQFTISGMLWGTFWLAISFAGFCYPRQPGHGLNFGYTYGPYLEPLAALMAIAALCPAVGAIMGRHARGLLIGLIVIGGCIAWVVALYATRSYPL